LSFNFSLEMKLWCLIWKRKLKTKLVNDEKVSVLVSFDGIRVYNYEKRVLTTKRSMSL
jgi:hypothetical protein